MYRSPQSAAGAVVAILRNSQQPLRRADLTERIGVTPASMGAALSKLADQGIVVVEHGVADGVGRPSPTIRLLPDAARSLTIVLGADGSGRLRLHDLTGATRVLERTPPVADAYASASNVVDAVHRGGEVFDGVVGVGIAAGDRVGRTPTADVVEHLRSKLGAVIGEVPVEVAEPDALAAVAAARGRTDGTLVLHLHSCGPGHVGASLAVAGDPFRLIDLRFDVAHMMLRVGGRPCRCGRRGCVAAELYTDDADVVDDRSGGIDADGLALTVDTVVRLVRPAVVVLGGTLAAHAAPPAALLAPLRAQGVTPPAAVVDVLIEPSRSSYEEAVHAGAAELALRQFLTEPALRRP